MSAVEALAEVLATHATFVDPVRNGTAYFAMCTGPGCGWETPDLPAELDVYQMAATHQAEQLALAFPDLPAVLGLRKIEPEREQQ